MINFPPTFGQPTDGTFKHAEAGQTWAWNGLTWKAEGQPGPTGPTGPTGPQGIQGPAGTGVKAWVNFNGTGTVAIRGSFNVSSITDNGNGDYTVNFATPLQDANYVVAMQGPGAITGSTWSHIPGLVNNAGSTTPTLKTTAAVRFFHFNPNTGNAGAYDNADCGVAIFR